MSTSSFVSIIAYLGDFVDTVINSYSYILIKQGLMKNTELNLSGVKQPLYCNMRWLFGFCLLFATANAHFIFLPYAELTLL